MNQLSVRENIVDVSCAAHDYLYQLLALQFRTFPIEVREKHQAIVSVDGVPLSSRVVATR